MSLRRNILWSLRAVAGALSVALLVERAAGEAIQFSKPALAIVVPPKPPENLPEDRARRMDFSGPEVEAPTVQPRPPVLRMNPREEKKDDRHWLLQDPKMFSDPNLDREKASEEKLQSGLGKSLLPDSGKLRDPMGVKRPGTPAALSPEGDFNWKAHDAVRRPDNSPWASRPNSFDKSHERGPAPIGLREDSGKGSLYFDAFNTRPKEIEKPTRAQLERRASFDELLNPGRANAGLAVRTPGSLDPVTSPDAVVAPAKLPAPVVPKVETKQYDPMQAFNLQHERLRGPVFEDPNKKYSTQPGGVSAPSTTVQPNQISPLMRPSGPRDIPARKF